MKFENFALRCAALLGALLFQAGVALAQGYPDRPVHIILGQPPGGVQDTLVRGVAQELSKVWGQPVILDNRVGGTGVVAGIAAAKAVPDGYTIFFSTSTNMNTAQFMHKDLPYRPEKDFVPVVGLAKTLSILVARNGLGVNSVKELVALAKSKPPGALNYGSFGILSAAHLDAEAFARAAGFSATHVPYKGGAEVMTGLLAEQVDFAMTALTAAIPLVRQGRLKGLAYTGDKRVGALPQMPTLAEAGYGGFETGGLFGLYVPAGTPPAVIDKIAADAGRVRDLPAIRDGVIFANGMEEFRLAGPALVKRLQESRDEFTGRIKGLDLKLN